MRIFLVISIALDNLSWIKKNIWYNSIPFPTGYETMYRNFIPIFITFADWYLNIIRIRCSSYPEDTQHGYGMSQLSLHDRSKFDKSLYMFNSRQVTAFFWALFFILRCCISKQYNLSSNLNSISTKPMLLWLFEYFMLIIDTVDE